MKFATATSDITPMANNIPGTGTVQFVLASPGALKPQPNWATVYSLGPAVIPAGTTVLVEPVDDRYVVFYPNG